MERMGDNIRTSACSHTKTNQDTIAEAKVEANFHHEGTSKNGGFDCK